jgi:hypothetical protein
MPSPSTRLCVRSGSASSRRLGLASRARPRPRSRREARRSRLRAAPSREGPGRPERAQSLPAPIRIRQERGERVVRRAFLLGLRRQLVLESDRRGEHVEMASPSSWSSPPGRRREQRPVRITGGAERRVSAEALAWAVPIEDREAARLAVGARAGVEVDRPAPHAGVRVAALREPERAHEGAVDDTGSASHNGPRARVPSRRHGDERDRRPQYADGEQPALLTSPP